MPPAAASPSQIVHDGEGVRVGRFRCAPGDPLFGDSGPTRGHLLVFPRETVEITHAGARPIVADPTRVMLYNRGQRYRRAALSPAGDRCEWFALPGDAVLAARRAHGWRDGDEDAPFGGTTNAPADPRAYLLARLVFAHVTAGAPVDRLLVAEAVLALLEHVVAGAAAATGRTSRMSRATRAHAELAVAAQAFLAARFTEPLSLAEVAAALGVSPFHLAHVFPRVTGSSLHAWRTQLRLRAALEHVVAAEPADLTVLALELGFSSHSHFTAAFRRAYGRPPSALRRLPARELRKILTA